MILFLMDRGGSVKIIYMRIYFGGQRRTRVNAHTRLAVMWPSGGGTEVSRVILRADDRSVEAAIYSFDKKIRNLEMRLCRIKKRQVPDLAS